MSETSDYSAYDLILEAFDEELAKAKPSNVVDKFRALASALTVPNIQGGVYSLPASHLSEEAVMLVFSSSFTSTSIENSALLPTSGQLESAAKRLNTCDSTVAESILQSIDESNKVFEHEVGSIGWVTGGRYSLEALNNTYLIRGRPVLFLDKKAIHSDLTTYARTVLPHELIHIESSLEYPLEAFDEDAYELEALEEEYAAYTKGEIFFETGHFPSKDWRKSIPGILRVIQIELENGSAQQIPWLAFKSRIDEIGLAGIYATERPKISSQQLQIIQSYVKKLYSLAIH